MPGVPPTRYVYLGPEGTFTEAALRRLYPDAPLAPLRYIDRGFARTRRRLEAERRDSLVFRRLEWIVSARQEETRDRRVAQAFDKLAAGKKRMY